MHTVCNQNICLKDFNQETCVLIHSTHACTFASVLHIGSNFIQLSCKFWDMHKKVTNLFVTSVERNGATQTHHSKKRKKQKVAVQKCKESTVVRWKMMPSHSCTCH